MIYRLLDSTSPSLRVRVPETTDDQLKEYNLTREELYTNLKGTMAAYGGIGLSSNQCGMPVRAFVMYTNFATKEIEFIMNPKVTWESEDTEMFREGCLTYPFLFLNIKRPKTVEFEYEDVNGEKKTGKYTGLTARVFQHEYDHMEGKNFTMYASPMKLALAQKQAKKKIKKSMKKAA